MKNFIYENGFGVITTTNQQGQVTITTTQTFGYFDYMERRFFVNKDPFVNKDLYTATEACTGARVFSGGAKTIKEAVKLAKQTLDERTKSTLEFRILVITSKHHINFEQANRNLPTLALNLLL